MEAEQKRTRNKAQALDRIALLVEAAKDLWVLLAKQLFVMFLRNTLFCNYYFDIILSMSRLKTVRV